LPLLDSLLGKVNDSIVKAMKTHEDSIMVTIGGDHSVGSATLHSLNTSFKDLKVIWVDAHPDFIDPSNSTYYGYHGYPAGHACGLSKHLIPGFSWLQNTIPF
jgi:arginase